MESAGINSAYIDTARLALDTGTLVLIWLVQLVIYPSMAYITKAQIDTWHPIYTQRVTMIVLPLMVGQVLVYLARLMICPTTAVWTSAVLIAAVWGLTFLWAVPLHSQMASATETSMVAKQLVHCNWYRTIIWSVVWMISVYSTIVK